MEGEKSFRTWNGLVQHTSIPYSELKGQTLQHGCAHMNGQQNVNALDTGNEWLIAFPQNTSPAQSMQLSHYSHL